ncbi:MAG: decaprenyl-phosphate phosphoribosyltransferase [Anaerolineae bacterium]|nr:decaprenyl-phosphate phosphoribosyltransferase [Anaerolineales bacterium]MCQ3973143.1 decaprenyl-phosphate phosphoribosyltransferase [Anaerolineae bacterium]
MLTGILKSLRPKQWTKNGFIFAALIFDIKLFQTEPFAKTLYGFVLLCFLSGTVYIINDLVDVEKDRQHPTKRNRPIASGSVPIRVAIISAVVLSVACLSLSFWLDPTFGIVALSYWLLQIAYSLILKNIVIVDVLTVAGGFVLRVAAGVVLVQAERFSPWLYVFTVLLALFLVLGKRRQELALLKEQATNTRAILDEYNLPFLDEMMAIVTAGTVMTYSFYTFSAPNLPANHLMMLTIPFVLYGIFRYLYVIHVQGNGGAPDEVLLVDRPLQISIVLFTLTAVAILYFR